MIRQQAFKGQALKNEATGFQRTLRDETRYTLVLHRSRMGNTSGEGILYILQTSMHGPRNNG